MMLKVKELVVWFSHTLAVCIVHHNLLCCAVKDFVFICYSSQNSYYIFLLFMVFKVNCLLHSYISFFVFTFSLKPYISLYHQFSSSLTFECFFLTSFPKEFTFFIYVLFCSKGYGFSVTALYDLLTKMRFVCLIFMVFFLKRKHLL